jgi:hypothetical protein
MGLEMKKYLHRVWREDEERARRAEEGGEGRKEKGGGRMKAEGRETKEEEEGRRREEEGQRGTNCCDLYFILFITTRKPFFFDLLTARVHSSVYTPPW